MYTCSVTQDVWRHLKSIVYATPVSDGQTLRERVHARISNNNRVFFKGCVIHHGEGRGMHCHGRTSH
ncbi:hypothetical protein C0J52_08319 [Blattella germanica]|nr:hypothetical protein C0J52_08319 [Blattella germanica]